MPHFILMLLSNGFDPDVRMHKQARALAAAGHRMEIYCWDREGCHRDKRVYLPNYPLQEFKSSARRFHARELRLSYIGYVRHLSQPGAHAAIFCGAGGYTVIRFI